MKTILLITLTVATALSLAPAEDNRTLGEKTADTLEKAKDKTEEAGRAVATTRKAVDKMIDAVTPDADARKVEVKLTEHRIDMPIALETGKTAFVVRNASTEKRNFEIRGEGIEKKFFAELVPDETKVLHVDLKAGAYKASEPVKDRESESPKLNLTVK